MVAVAFVVAVAVRRSGGSGEEEGAQGGDVSHDVRGPAGLQLVGRGVAPGHRDAVDAVLPGSLLAREAHGLNPGAGRIRLALVAEEAECLEAARRIVSFTKSLA